MPSSIPVYGIVFDQPLGVYWLYIADGIPNLSGRLVWAIQTVADPTQADAATLNNLIAMYGQINLNAIISPSDSYIEEYLHIIIGA
jgi:hypothetical protein